MFSIQAWKTPMVTFEVSLNEKSSVLATQFKRFLKWAKHSRKHDWSFFSQKRLNRSQARKAHQISLLQFLEMKRLTRLLFWDLMRQEWLTRSYIWSSLKQVRLIRCHFCLFLRYERITRIQFWIILRQDMLSRGRFKSFSTKVGQFSLKWTFYAKSSIYRVLPYK